MRLRRLEIKKFRDVKPCTLVFHDELNIVLGQNASGKTTLLDIIAAVTSDDFTVLEQRSEEFELAWEFALGEVGVENGSRCSGEFRRVADIELREIDLGDRVETHEHRVPRTDVVLRLEVAGKRFGELRSDLNVITLHGNDGRVAASAPYARIYGPMESMFIRFPAAPPHEGWNGWGIELHQSDEEPRFDEALGGFQSLLALSRLSAQGHMVTARFAGGGEPVEWRGPLWLERAFDRAEPPLGPARLISFQRLANGERSVAAVLGFGAVECHPLLGRSVVRDHRTVVDVDRLAFRFVRPGSTIPHDHLSFGQKRMFSLLHYLGVRRGPYVLDEPGNGLHYEWIREMFKRIEGHQTFIATQHPFLLDLVPVADIDAVKRGFIRCEADPSGTMCWQNFTDEEAARFMAAYDTGVPQLSEVLRLEKLW